MYPESPGDRRQLADNEWYGFRPHTLKRLYDRAVALAVDINSSSAVCFATPLQRVHHGLDCVCRLLHGKKRVPRPPRLFPFTDGDLISFSQNSWGADPAAGPPAQLAKEHFDSIYPTCRTVGIGNFVVFASGNNGDPVLAFLPQVGPPTALNSILVARLPASVSTSISATRITRLVRALNPVSGFVTS